MYNPFSLTYVTPFHTTDSCLPMLQINQECNHPLASPRETAYIHKLPSSQVRFTHLLASLNETITSPRPLDFDAKLYLHFIPNLLHQNFDAIYSNLHKVNSAKVQFLH